jgi:lysine-specific permease
MKPPSPALRELLEEPSAAPPEVHINEYRKDLTLMGLVFLSLGNAIGSGLMYGSGTAVKSAGPAGILISFLGATFTGFVLLAAIAEMSTRSPNTGGVVAMCESYIDESSALAIGYSVVISTVAGTSTGMQAISSCVAYWLPSIPRWVWGIVSWMWAFVINCLPVRYFSYVQRTMVGIEIVIVTSLTISVMLCAFGAIGHSDYHGRFWAERPFGIGISGFADAWLIATFSFDGSEHFATTSGEAKETRRSLKRVTYIVFIVLVLIYGINYIFIGIVVGPDEMDLGDVSPFTLILEHAGVGAAADLVNAAVIVVLSCVILGVSYFYSRMARELAVNGRGPKILSGITSWGVPIPAVFATMTTSALVYAISFFSEDGFSCAVALSGALSLITKVVVSVALLRFRKAYCRVSDKIAPASYIAPCWPWAQRALIVICPIVFVAALGSPFANGQLLKGCMTLAGTLIIACIYIIHKLIRKAPFITINQIEERLLANEKRAEASVTSFSVLEGT